MLGIRSGRAVRVDQIAGQVAGQVGGRAVAAEVPAALISVVIWVPAPAGSIATHHVPHQSEYFRLTAAGVTNVAL